MAESAVPVNLSAGGMCAGVDEAYEPGELLEITHAAVPIVYRTDDLRHRDRMRPRARGRAVDVPISSSRGSNSPISGNRTANCSSGTCCGARATNCAIARRKTHEPVTTPDPVELKSALAGGRADARRGKRPATYRHDPALSVSNAARDSKTCCWSPTGSCVSVCPSTSCRRCGGWSVVCGRRGPSPKTATGWVAPCHCKLGKTGAETRQSFP